MLEVRQLNFELRIDTSHFYYVSRLRFVPFLILKPRRFQGPIKPFWAQIQSRNFPWIHLRFFEYYQSCLTFKIFWVLLDYHLGYHQMLLSQSSSRLMLYFWNNLLILRTFWRLQVIPNGTQMVPNGTPNHKNLIYEIIQSENNIRINFIIGVTFVMNFQEW